jgi:uncharacterized membrane protein
MAGIGVKLNKIFQKNTIITNLYGFSYSAIVTIAPMFVVIGNILLMGKVLGFSKVGYLPRELFACSVLYIFIFSLLSASPFNAVLSRYMSDVIYEERYQDILPCYYLGMLMNLTLSCLIGIPFCIHEYFVGRVELYYVCTGFFGYISLVLVFYSMLYLSICKDYKKISFYFFLGMLVAFLLSWLFVFKFYMAVPYSMLLALSIGFFLTACLEFAKIKSYFKVNSNQYRRILQYFGRYWELIITNFFYTLGLYVHNFVFWTTDMKMVVVNSFVCAQPYDMATCLAMFTNLTASVIFLARVEMHFHDRYKAYSEAVIGGRGCDIRISKERLFMQLMDEIMNMVRIQFIVTVVVFLLFVILLPQYGFSGLTMQIYPCLAAGYFILFVMYAEILFLYYFNDLKGAALTAVVFCLTTFIGSVVATHLPSIWYGIGLWIGTFAGWTTAYIRLCWVERNLDTHIFCRGTLLKKGRGEKPSNKVYDIYEKLREEQQKAKEKEDY